MTSEQYFKSFQDKLVKNVWYRYFWQFWSNYAFVIFAVGIVVFLVHPNLRKVWPEALLLAGVSFLIARGIMVSLINAFYKKLRPYQQFKFSPITSRFFSFKTKIPNSFPSRHTTAYFSVATVLFLFFPLLGAGLMLVSILAGMARVILGYHWPSDIAVGALLGIVVGYSTALLGCIWFFT